ncbi:MAG: FAD-dependent oxidoreductase [Anaerolineae bacterium]|nr:FAD-dependent oxidoreductase [Anaerolineae bacterium]
MSEQVYECDVAVVGGSMGGVAAALAAVEAGCSVVLTEGTDWLGGQITSQGVSALDEHRYIESYGGTQTYNVLRQRIRQMYRERYGMPETMPDGRPLNPGNGWVSALCFEPRVGLAAIEEMLAPHTASDRLRILRSRVPVEATVEMGRVTEVLLGGGPRHTPVRVRAQVFLDATDLGDLLPLTGTAYVTGAEARSDTGEAHASPDGPHPDEVQGFTYCFAVAHCPGQDHTIDPPVDYARFRDEQPYTLVLRGHHGEARPFRMFTEGSTGLPPFWTYRRLIDGALLDPSGAQGDVAMINWSGNDYHWANVIDKSGPERAHILAEAQQLAFGFLYWLQTEAPRDDGQGRGYPGMRLLPAVMGTRHGLSKAPYIRESRRIVPQKRIVEGEIAREGRAGARAAPFHDAIGIGWYAMDLHDCVGNPTSMYAPTLPFQIPLGALIPRQTTNLIAACKNIGTTHLTNGAYRLHPVEWNIGESAGTAAAYCCAHACTPRQVREEEWHLRRLQYALVKRGVPLAWTVDVPQSHALFAATQMLAAWGALECDGSRWQQLEVAPDEPLSAGEARALVRSALRLTRGATELHDAGADGGSPVGRAYIERLLRGHSLPAPALSDLTRWGEVVGALSPLIRDAVGR